jgi:hypothetical protein
MSKTAEFCRKAFRADTERGVNQQAKTIIETACVSGLEGAARGM